VTPVVAVRAPRRRLARIFRRPAPMRAGETLRVFPLVLPVTALGAAGLGLAVGVIVLDPPAPREVVGALGLVAASLIAEAFPMQIERVRAATTLAMVFIVSAAVLYGWAVGAVVGFVTMFVIEVARRRPPVRVAYNAALYTWGGIAAGASAAIVGGESAGALVAKTLLAAVAFYGVNIALLSAVVALSRHAPFVPTARDHYVSTAAPFLILASLAGTLVVLWDRSPFVTVVLIAPLLGIALYQRWLYGALQRLREFDRLKDEFIAVISHELRTPLTSVYGAAVTLQQHELDEPMRQSLLQIISSESQRLARLLDDVLWASRLDTGRDRTLVEPIDAAVVAEQVVDAARSRLPASLSLELDVQAELPHAEADPDRLRQVLVNLIDNAVKYSPNGGRIRVRIERIGRDVSFNVSDEGLGIPEAERDRVFDRFYRLDPNMSRGVGGTGLGLYICRELVHRMHGRIWVEPNDGRGTTFVFTLPVART
jgi:signal transduction histidine kinase